MTAEPPLSSAALEALSAALLTATVLFTVLSAMLERSGPIRLRHWTQGAGGELARLYGQPIRFEVFRLAISFAARLAPAALLVSLALTLISLGVESALAWSLGAVALLMAVVELLNRVLVGRDPERVLERLTAVYRALHVLLRPVIAALAPLLPARAVERLEDEEDDEATDEEIEAFIDVGAKEGILDPEEGDLILRLIDFGDSQVKSVMTPRPDMVCASASNSGEELASLFFSSKHSRIPMYKETVDEILGVLHIRDLFESLHWGSDTPVVGLLKAPHFVPETKLLSGLLSEMQSMRQQMAIVVDEYGGTAGLVTIEDLLEEIVGEIVDEDEELPPDNERLADGSWRIQARTPLDDLGELFDRSIEDDAYETVGGLIFGRLGYVPKKGEQIEAYGLRLVVERVEERRIQTVIVDQASDGEEPGDG